MKLLSAPLDELHAELQFALNTRPASWSGAVRWVSNRSYALYCRGLIFVIRFLYRRRNSAGVRHR